MVSISRITALFIFLLIGGVSLAFNPVPGTGHDQKEASTGQLELVLLRSEHFLFLNASENIGTFHLRYTFPPVYDHQTPLYLEMYNDTTADILTYSIEDEKRSPNMVVNFTIGSMEKDEETLLHFSCWVLVNNKNFSDLPRYMKMPKQCALPKETKPWLSATPVVQKNSILIKHKAQQLQGASDNLILFADKIAFFIKHHHYLLFLLELNLDVFFSQDALTTLFLNGENVGRSHLACALFRSQGVPARVILAHNDQGFWTQMHYMVEYYCPGYGWVLLDSTKGETPYDTKRQIINRICYPEDEKDTKTDYIFPLMKGEERWLWIDNEHVSPVYIDCNKGSKSQMFQEGDVFSDSVTAGYAFSLTTMVFRLYQTYLGKNLIGENLHHFNNATDDQLQAIHKLKGSDIQGYIDALNRAYTEYSHIHLV